ncbi:MAG: hypothetical protein GX254_04585 [Clostridiales bacterium]|jgi:uncharacterized membrane protein YvlD (DUF360 family)|nr:hypothetical protein [Clostridiales bacterium]
MCEFDALAIIGVTGVLSFFVGLIVELTKELPGIVRLPTKLYAIIVSAVVCEMALWVYAGFAGIAATWYAALLALFASFVVSAISVFGRDMLGEIYSRYKLREFYSRYKQK